MPCAPTLLLPKSRSAVADNPNNVLSVVVTTRARFATASPSAMAWRGAGLDSASPAVKSGGDSAVVPVLGLLPETRYVSAGRSLR